MGFLYFLAGAIMICFGCDSPKQLPFNDTFQHLRLSFQYNPMTIDPRKNGDPVSCSLINMLYEGLVHLEPDGTISLGLAEDIEISSSQTKYIFHLKHALWSNGDPITAYDIEFSWKSILSPEFQTINAYFLYPIRNARSAKMGLVSVDDVGIYAKDAHTLIIHLERPSNYFLKMVAFATYFPVSKQIENSVKEGYHPLFSGPFILQEWHQNDYLILKKNPYFWNAANVRLEEIHISIIPDDNTALQLYQLHELDWLTHTFSTISPTELKESSKGNNLHIVDSAGTTMCFFNIQCFPFDNVHIRKAFSYAIEKELIVEHLCQGDEIPAYGLIPPLLKEGSSSKLIPISSKELARHHFELGLKETGLSKETFPPITFSIYSLPSQKILALALQQQWLSTLGVNVNIELSEIKLFLDKLYKKNYQLALMSILAQYFDPMNFLERFTSTLAPKNFSGWHHPDFLHLTEIASEASLSQEKLKLFEQAESLIMNEAPIAPIYHHSSIYISRDALKNVQISPIGSVDFRYAYIQNSENY